MAARLKRLPPKINWLGLAGLAGFVALWQIVIGAKLITAHSLAAPSGIWRGLRSLASTGDLWPELGHTVRAIAIAWALAVVIGGLLGLLLGSNERLAVWTRATVDIFRSLPIIAFVPIAILIWGPATKAEVIVAGYAAVWPMLLNTAAGVRAVAPRLRDVAATLRLSRRGMLWKIVLPATAPAMIVGARISLGLSLIICFVTEMLGPPFGIGHGLMIEQSADQPERVWAYAVLAGLLGVSLNAVLVAGTRLMLPGVSRLTARDAE